MRFPKKWLPYLLFSLLLTWNSLVWVSPIGAQSPPGEIRGQIRISQGQAANAEVWLMRFVLDDQQRLQGEVLQIARADKQGRYRFTNITTTQRSVFQVFARIAEQVWKSQPLAFSQNRLIEAEVSLPTESHTVPTPLPPLSLARVVLAAEPQVAGIWITEVLHLQNTQSSKIWNPPPIPLPQKAQYPQFLDQNPTLSPSFQNNALTLSGSFPKGQTIIAYRYFLPVWWGAVTIQRQFPLPIGQLSIIAPPGPFQAQGPAVQSAPPRQIEGHNWNAWQRHSVPSQTPVILHMNHIPRPQQIWLLLLPIVLVPVFLLAWHSQRKRH